MSSNSINFDIPDKVVSLLRSGRCVAYLGSGLSREIFPSWPCLINDLCSVCDIDRRVSKTAEPEELLDAAQAALDKDNKKYYKRIKEIFEKTQPTNPLYGLLWRINFKSYITSNYDRLLIDFANLAWKQGNMIMKYPGFDRQYIRDKIIYHIHGLVENGVLPDGNSIVLSKSEFAKAYGECGPVKTFLLETFKFDPICFIGCQLKEPAFKEVFNICKVHQEMIRDVGGGSIPDRYIFLPRNEISVSSETNTNTSATTESILEDQDEYYSEFNIKVVRYDPINKSHIGLYKQFKIIADIPELPVTFGFSNGGGNGI